MTLPKEIDFKSHIDKMVSGARRVPFLTVYVKELDYEPDKQAWLFIYKPLIFSIQFYILLAAFGSTIFFGFNKIFYALLSIALIVGFFFSKYFPMIVMWVKFHKDNMKFV